jgi:hypothetical protein
MKVHVKVPIVTNHNHENKSESLDKVIKVWSHTSSMNWVGQSVFVEFDPISKEFKAK